MDHQNPRNHPVYVVEDDIGSSVFHLNDEEPEITVNRCINQSLKDQQHEVWNTYFDDSSSKEVVGASIVLVSLTHKVIMLSYKLEFETTNNIAKYETPFLGLSAAKDMAIDSLEVFGNFE
jgi:hypothetical protein